MGSAELLQGEPCWAVLGIWGAHRHPWLFQLLELEPQPHWDCLGMPGPQGPGEHSSAQAGSCAYPSCHWRSETRPWQQTQGAQCQGSPGNLCVGAAGVLPSPVLPLQQLLSVPKDGVAGGNAAVLNPNPCHSVTQSDKDSAWGLAAEAFPSLQGQLSHKEQRLGSRVENDPFSAE